jgi:WD40 repeat protein
MPPPKVTQLLAAGIPRFLHEGDVESVAFAPDGRTLLASDPYATTMWNPASGKVRWRKDGGGVAAFLDDEYVLVSGYFNSTIFAAAKGGIVSQLPWFASHAVGIALEGIAAALAFHTALTNEKGAGLVVVDGKGAIIVAEGQPSTLDAIAPLAEMRPALVAAKLAASPDGKILVASERRREQRTTRALASRTLEEHWQIDVGGDIAFSPDGTLLGLCDRGELIYLDPRTGKELARAPHKDLRAFAFSADGSRVALAKARTVEIVDARSFTTLMTLEPFGMAPDGRITALAFSPDGQLLAVGLTDRVTLFELASHEERDCPAGHARGVWAIALPGEGVVVTRGAHETKTWRIASGELLSTQSRAEEIRPIPALAVTPEGALLDAEPGAIRVKNARGDVAATLEPTPPMPLAAGKLLVAPHAGTALAMIPEQAEGGQIATLRLFSLQTFAQSAASSKLSTWLSFDSALAISPDGTRIAVPHSSQYDDTFSHKVVVRDAASGEVVGETETRAVVSLAFLDASRLLVATPGTLELFTLGGGLERITLSDAAEGSDDDDEPYATHIVVSPNGRLVALGNEDDGTVRLCEAGRWNEAVLCAKRIAVRALCFSADSRTLAAGLRDGSLRVWSIDS